MLTYKARRPAIKPWSRAIILGGVSQDGEKNLNCSGAKTNRKWRIHEHLRVF
jgi:hypothetical protein